ncbi:MAG: hypothetical protein H6981_06915 [Gammaproteobacteria bacterium]|nr:hypothetical protein [Gammaproteobacteria bacterium]MCP5136514.1 hypothetical protein [Gammaproteobacteria bacterium]
MGDTMWRVMMVMLVSGCLFSPQAFSKKAIYEPPGGHFKIVAKGVMAGDGVPTEAMMDLFNALETARDFYADLGFSVPDHLRVRLKEVKSDNLGGYVPNILSMPGTHQININVLVNEDGVRTGLNATNAQRRVTAAHELFHAVQFMSLTGTQKLALGKAWLRNRADSADASMQTDFWPIFEGMAETMAWMIFPQDFTNPAYSDTLRGQFWFSPNEYDGMNQSCGTTPPYPYRYVNPWQIPLWTSQCGWLQKHETAGAYTVPFWLALSQQVNGRPIRTGNTVDYRPTAQAMAAIWRSVARLMTASVNSKQLAASMQAGLTDFLHSRSLTRADIRDRLTLATGVERFTDDPPRHPKDYGVTQLRDFELGGLDQESRANHLSWLLTQLLYPPNGQAGNTTDLVIPFMTNTVPTDIEEGRLITYDYPDELPAFANLSLSRSHPLTRSTVVPPAAIEAVADGLTPTWAPPLMIAGFRDSGSTRVAPQLREIVGDGSQLDLNNFLLRDVSLLQLAKRHGTLRYRYKFLGNNGPLGRGQSNMMAPDTGEWLIYELLPDRRLHSEVVSVMLTPSAEPAEPSPAIPASWYDSEIFDVVPRTEDRKGIWGTGNAGLDVRYQVLQTPPLSGSPGNRARVDIARHRIGNQGGGQFWLSAVSEDLDANPKPDLIVRTLKVDYLPGSVGSGAGSSNCAASNPTVSVYVTNQGTAHAAPVRVRIAGSYESRRLSRSPGTPGLVVVTPHTIDDSIHIQGGIAPGETRRVRFVLSAHGNETATAVQARIKVDSRSKVDEALENNNVAITGPVDNPCGSSGVPLFSALASWLDSPASTDFDNADWLQALTQIEDQGSEATRRVLSPILRWMDKGGARPDDQGDARFSALLDRLSRLRARRARHDASAPKLTPVALTAYPGWLRLSPAGLVLEDEGGITPADPTQAIALVNIPPNLPDGDIYFNDVQTQYDSGDKLIPVPPGQARIELRDEDGALIDHWELSAKAGAVQTLSPPLPSEH